MGRGGRPGVREALRSLGAFAWRDLDRHRLAARVWHRLDVVLFVPAATLAALSGMLGLTGVVDRMVGVLMALAAAVLVGLRILLDPARRARRAYHAATYLRLLTSEIGIVETVYLDSWPAAEAGAAVVELRRWYERITTGIAGGADQLSPELLQSPLRLGAAEEVSTP